MAIDLRKQYQDYINALNSRDWESLERFVAPKLSHNGRDFSENEYTKMLETFAQTAPDQTYNADDIVVEDNSSGQGDGRVAARIRLVATPQVGEDFAGVRGTGKTAEFWEYCFYWFEGGKIVNVRSLIDMKGLEAALDQR